MKITPKLYSPSSHPSCIWLSSFWQYALPNEYELKKVSPSTSIQYKQTAFCICQIAYALRSMTSLYNLRNWRDASSVFSVIWIRKAVWWKPDILFHNLFNMDFFFYTTASLHFRRPLLTLLSRVEYVYIGWIWMETLSLAHTRLVMNTDIIKLGCLRIFINISTIVFIRKMKVIYA